MEGLTRISNTKINPIRGIILKSIGVKLEKAELTDTGIEITFPNDITLVILTEEEDRVIKFRGLKIPDELKQKLLPEIKTLLTKL